MYDFFTCENCWNFHVRGKAEQGTCRARLKPVKTNKNERCTYPKGFTFQRIVATYSIVDKRGGQIRGIKDPNDAIDMLNDLNKQIRKELMQEGKEQNNG